MSRRPNRSVSVALNYVLVLGITTILIAGLLTAGTGFVEDNREQVVGSELSVIGTHIAGNVEQVDRLVNASRTNAGPPAIASVNQSFQERVTGSTYRVELVDNDPVQIVLTAVDLDVTARVNVTVNNEVRETTVGGGDISVSYDNGTDRLVIDDA